MRIEFLVEDISEKKLITEIMEKYISEIPLYQIEYTILAYRGMGGFGKGPDAGNIKSRRLLNDLPKRMKAIQSKFRGVENVSLFIVLDNDTRETEKFREQLTAIAIRENISMDYVFCIAIEEMEAWLLGDREAIQSAFPNMSDRIASKYSGYVQDSICGTWEYLADILTKGGFAKFSKKNPTPFDVGRCKLEWAESIGKQLHIRDNTSPSFRCFIRELDKRRDACFASRT